MPNAFLDPNSPLPLYYQVFSSLLERIQRGEFPLNTSLPPERKLVDEYEVSRGTIVKAMDMLEQKGWISRQQGRGNYVTDPTSVEDRGSHVIVVLAALDNSYEFSVLSGIAREATRQRCRLNIIGSFSEADERRYANEAIHLGATGVITYPDSGFKNLALYQQFHDRGVPIVMVDRYFPQIKTDRVVFNDEEASYELTRRLIAKGHQRIAVIPHAEIATTSVENRLSGYRRAIAEHGLSFDEDLVWLDVYSSYRPNWNKEWHSSEDVEELYSRFAEHQPTAVLAINTEVAERLSYDLLAINERGMRAVINGANNAQYQKIGVDIAVFSHRQTAGHGVSPSLVAMQPGEWLGEQAAKLLISRLNHEETGPSRTIEVPMRIVESDLEQIELFLVGNSTF